MRDENPESLVADRVRLLLRLARLRRTGQRIWLVTTERGLVLLEENGYDAQGR